jgi:hypothetical protein
MAEISASSFFEELRSPLRVCYGRRRRSSKTNRERCYERNRFTVACAFDGGCLMGMQILKQFLLKAAGVAPFAREPDWSDYSDRICVLASQGPGGAVHRAEKLYSCEDAKLVASELNREWPAVKYWAAPATADEMKAHAARAARLIRSIARELKDPRSER